MVGTQTDEKNQKYQKAHKKNIWGSPYPFHETLEWVVRNGLGASNKNSELTQSIPKKGTLYPDIDTKYCICAVGDIMDMRGSDLSIGPNLSTYVEKNDTKTTYYLGNFEATITDKKGPSIYQKHKPQIIDALAELFPPERTYLSIANNHAGDFEPEIFHNSIKLLENAGFHIFGLKSKPTTHLSQSIQLSTSITSDISVTTASQWSNLDTDIIPYLDDKFISDLEANRGDNGLKIFYPHWGYEMERYPRPETIEFAERLLFKHSFTTIIGHHTHCPQPVTLLSDNSKSLSGSVRGDEGGSDNINIPRKLVAYSLGDFCTGLKIEKYRHGIFLRNEFGVSISGEYVLKNWEWDYIKCARKNSSLCEVEFQNT